MDDYESGNDEISDVDEGELYVFWPGPKPKFTDSRNFQIYNAAKVAAGKVRNARRDAQRKAKHLKTWATRTP